MAALAGAGTRVMFGVPGGGPNLDVVGAAAAAGLRFVLTHTENAAAIMAATSADLTGAPGAVLVTRGPGLASAVNGIAHAALDRLPLVVIADTVRAGEAGRVSHQRLDQGALGRSVAKAALTVGGDRQAGQAAARLVGQALAAPPGPVVALMDDSALASSAHTADDPGPAPGAATPGQAPRTGITPAADLAPLASALRMARRPVLLLGARAIAHTAAIRAAVVGRGIPALHTYRARGIVPDSAAEAAGLVTGGTMEWPLLAQADLIIGLGVDEAEMIPAGWDYAAPTVMVGDWPAGLTGATGYFAGATTLTAPLPAAIDVLAGWTPPAGSGWTPVAGRAARADAAHRLAKAAATSPAGATGWIRFLNRDGSVQLEQRHRYRFSSWNTIYRSLLSLLEARRYELGTEVTGFAEQDGTVTVTLGPKTGQSTHTGQSIETDLLVCADGVGSAARARLLPAVRPAYAGYVAWRGTVPEHDLSPGTRKILGDALTYQVLPDSHILVYPIPALDGSLTEGDRLINIVWYVNVAPGEPLDTLMTGRDGVRRPVSLPPGAATERAVTGMRQAARDQLAGPIAEAVVTAPEPWAASVPGIRGSSSGCTARAISTAPTQRTKERTGWPPRSSARRISIPPTTGGSWTRPRKTWTWAPGSGSRTSTSGCGKYGSCRVSAARSTRTPAAISGPWWTAGSAASAPRTER